MSMRMMMNYADRVVCVNEDRLLYVAPLVLDDTGEDGGDAEGCNYVACFGKNHWVRIRLTRGPETLLPVRGAWVNRDKILWAETRAEDEGRLRIEFVGGAWLLIESESPERDLEYVIGLNDGE